MSLTRPETAIDGLDELKAELQKPCAEALNQYFSGEQAPEYIVAACRAEEYGSLKTRLQLNGAIHLKSLNNEQIKIYLTHTGREDLWKIISEDAQLMDLLKTPLMLVLVLDGINKASIYEVRGLPV